MGAELHPAENRGYRELYAFARRLADHWAALAGAAAGIARIECLADGARTAERLIAELEPLTAAHGLHGTPAAQGLGPRSASGARSSATASSSATRRCATPWPTPRTVRALLGYLAAVGKARGDERDLADFSARWERELGTLERGRARSAGAELGSDPDGAIEPVDGSKIGRAAHGMGYAVGTAGEWFDRQASGRGRS